MKGYVDATSAYASKFQKWIVCTFFGLKLRVSSEISHVKKLGFWNTTTGATKVCCEILTSSFCCQGISEIEGQICCYHMYVFDCEDGSKM